MTKVASFIHGIYPRSEELVSVSRDLERKRKTQTDLQKQRKKDSLELLTLQKKADFAFIEDGKLSWQDIFRPIIESTQGLSVGPLTRWFDNNSFYRQPIITGTLKLSPAKIDAHFLTITPTKKWKVTLPSPYTFAILSQDKTTESFEETLTTITALLSKLVAILEKKGVSVIQFNEPYIPYFQSKKSEIKLLEQSLTTISQARKKAKLALHFSFGDAAPILLALGKHIPVDIVGIDFYKTDIASLPVNVSYDIIAGIIDGRNSLLEKETVLVSFIKKVLKTMNPPTLYVANNSDLELLPEPVAKQKLQILENLQKKEYIQ